MAIASARVGPQSLSVKCRICGRPSVRGAKLCDECVAAVKRARHVNTITSEYLPQSGLDASPYPLVRTPRSSLRRRSARWSWLPTKPSGWGVLIAFTIFGAAVAGTAWLAVQEIAERSPRTPMVSPVIDSTASRPGSLPPTLDTWTRAPSAPAPAASSAPNEQAVKAEAVDMPRTEPPPAIVEPPQATPVPEKSLPRKTSTENRRKPTARTNVAPVSGAESENKAAVAAPERTATAPSLGAAVVPTRIAPDRWEAMNAALAACSGEGFVAGIMCTERVRYQYCEGYWGRVEQCRAAARPGSSR